MPRKLRITILGLNYSPEPTGNAPYTASLAEGLLAAGHQVTVITGYPHYPEWRLKDGYAGWQMKEDINGVDVKRLRHFIPVRPSGLSRLLMEVTFGLRTVFARWNKPDVVLVISPALFSSGMAILRCRIGWGRPAVGIWVQDLYSRGVVETRSGSSRLAFLMRLAESSILRSSHGVVAIHDRFREFISSSLGVDPDRIKVIRNWTHLPESPRTDRQEFRRSLGWANDDVVVLHAGNMGMKQGLENVVEAARIADSSKSPVRFVLMGDGNQRQRLEELAQGVARLDFLDPLPGSEFQRSLVSADVLLVNELPGVSDMAVPSKLTSYFNAGVPVIAATDPRSVTSGEIEASEGGIRVDAANPEALVRAAEQLGRDSQLAAELGKKGLRFRNETLSREAAIAKYDVFISSLASTRGR
ncbi:glycosyltransferase [Arthrobacter sp. IA7]|uniref:glycosyltransferase n=1 Tax=Arthrobacter ipis TaxID=2716202 RepID=UPI001685189B|nr:glycosyltransferase [Arthrobacter ipis]MBD1541863.1 glycosyltransferase [Arthrobacter ipis]